MEQNTLGWTLLERKVLKEVSREGRCSRRRAAVPWRGVSAARRGLGACLLADNQAGMPDAIQTRACMDGKSPQAGVFPSAATPPATERNAGLSRTSGSWPAGTASGAVATPICVTARPTRSCRWVPGLSMRERAKATTMLAGAARLKGFSFRICWWDLPMEAPEEKTQAPPGYRRLLWTQ